MLEETGRRGALQPLPCAHAGAGMMCASAAMVRPRLRACRVQNRCEGHVQSQSPPQNGFPTAAGGSFRRVRGQSGCGMNGMAHAVLLQERADVVGVRVARDDVHVAVRLRDGQQVGVDRVLACPRMPKVTCRAAPVWSGPVWSLTAPSRACIASESVGWRARAQCSMVHE